MVGATVSFLICGGTICALSMPHWWLVYQYKFYECQGVEPQTWDTSVLYILWCIFRGSTMFRSGISWINPFLALLIHDIPRQIHCWILFNNGNMKLLHSYSNILKRQNEAWDITKVFLLHIQGLTTHSLYQVVLPSVRRYIHRNNTDNLLTSLC